MIQTIQGITLYVVDLDTIPPLPITGNGWEKPYANALTQAILRKVINKPGKYGIHVDHTTQHWSALAIIEP